MATHLSCIRVYYYMYSELYYTLHVREGETDTDIFTLCLFRVILLLLNLSATVVEMTRHSLKRFHDLKSFTRHCL